MGPGQADGQGADGAAVGGLVRQASLEGYARLSGVLAGQEREALLEEADGLEYLPLEPLIGRVSQAGSVARVRPFDPSLPRLGHLARALQEGVRRSGVVGTQRFLPNEAMYQRYDTSHDGISAHRDQGFYRLVVAVFTLEGRAPFTVLDRVTEEPVVSWVTEPGDLLVMAGGGLGDRDRRPPHRVGPPAGRRRTSLTLRMKERADRAR